MLNQSPIDLRFKALAEPTRRAIVERLGRGPASVSDLAAPFDMTLAAVVQHLQVLEDSGLIRTDKLGRVRICSLDPAGLDSLADWVAARRARVERSLDRLGRILEESEPAPPPRRKPNPPRKVASK